jgi:hypothetical protein
MRRATVTRAAGEPARRHGTLTRASVPRPVKEVAA